MRIDQTATKGSCSLGKTKWRKVRAFDLSSKPCRVQPFAVHADLLPGHGSLGLVRSICDVQYLDKPEIAGTETEWAMSAAK